MHYYHFNIGDYRKDTNHLTPIEHYIYRTLIDWYYLDESPIPKETQVVMRRLSLDHSYEPNLQNVLRDFFFFNENGWKHKRINNEIIEYHEQCEKNRVNGKLGGRPKKTQVVSERLPHGNPNKSETNPNQEPLTTNHKPNKYIPPINGALLSDWLEVRKAKRSGKLTETAFKGLQREARLAGLSDEQAVKICCERGWQSFKAEWMDKPKSDKYAETLAGLTGSGKRTIDVTPT